MEYETRVTELTVVVKGEALFSETATKIEIVDEAAGEFIKVLQELGTIAINPEDWPAIRNAIQQLIDQCREAD